RTHPPPLQRQRPAQAQGARGSRRAHLPGDRDHGESAARQRQDSRVRKRGLGRGRAAFLRRAAQPFRARAPGARGALTEHRHLDARADRERLRLRAVVFQAGARPRSAGRRAVRDFHQRQLEERHAGSRRGPRARDARGRPHRARRRGDRQAPRSGGRAHLRPALADGPHPGSAPADAPLPVRRNRLHAVGGGMKQWFAVGLLLASTAMLQACAEALIVGGVAVGVMMAADRRQTEVMLADQGIEFSAGSKIDEALKGQGHINVTSYNYTVLLTGEVPTAQAKADAEKAASEVPKVRTVVNELQIAGTSSAASRSNDAYITSKVKSSFLGNGKFKPTDIKVVTEASVVYLLGLVTREE